MARKHTNDTRSFVCSDLKAFIPNEPVTPERLSSHPGDYVPLLAFILKTYNEEHRNAEKGQTNLPRLFALSPMPSFHWRFIEVNSKALACLCSEAAAETYDDQLELFWSVFQLEKFGYSRYVMGTEKYHSRLRCL